MKEIFPITCVSSVACSLHLIRTEKTVASASHDHGTPKGLEFGNREACVRHRWSPKEGTDLAVDHDDQ